MTEMPRDSFRHQDPVQAYAVTTLRQRRGGAALRVGITLALLVATSIPQSLGQEDPQDPSLNYGGLIDDMKFYKTTNRKWHAGDVYAHSVWTARAIEMWFEEKKFWVHGIDEKDKKLVIVAGFLHDIGKAGRGTKPGEEPLVWEGNDDPGWIGGDFRYYDRSDHETFGMEYLLGTGTHRYYLKGGGKFDFEPWFKQLGFSSDERKLIATLVGAHWALGDLMKPLENIREPSDLEKLGNDEKVQKFIGDLRRINGGGLDARVVRLAILVTAADVRATLPVKFNSTVFAEDFKDARRSPGGDDKYKLFQYETEGKAIREYILGNFERLNRDAAR